VYRGAVWGLHTLGWLVAAATRGRYRRLRQLTCAPIRGCSSMARVPAFQAGYAGSIPVTRSLPCAGQRSYRAAPGARDATSLGTQGCRRRGVVEGSRWVTMWIRCPILVDRVEVETANEPRHRPHLLLGSRRVAFELHAWVFSHAGKSLATASALGRRPDRRDAAVEMDTLLDSLADRGVCFSPKLARPDQLTCLPIANAEVAEIADAQANRPRRVQSNEVS
jgi:hypothetical protein